MSRELETLLPALNLTEQQKKSLLKVIDSSVSKIESVYDGDRELDDQFDVIIEDVSNLLGK
ncbi:MAG: hypothetical protein KJP11_04780 [Gammaproteobacteria bacterium]|nr:hypothetical protein [Gammaproteobacteria bacterium]